VRRYLTPASHRPSYPDSSRIALSLLAAGLLLTVPAVAQQSDPGVIRSGEIIISPFDPSQARVPYIPPTPDDRFEQQDEVAFAQALSLVRTGQSPEGLDILLELLDRYPASTRLISATAGTYTRMGRADESLRLISRGVRNVEEELRQIEDEQERPPVPQFSVERADAYLALRKESKAIEWMVLACAERPAESARLRGLLLDWASDPRLGPRVAREVGEKSDEAPENVALAMLAAELEGLAGEWDRVWPRLQRTEDIAVQGRKGELLRALGHRMGSRPGAPPGSDAPIWLELTRGPYSTPIRYEGMRLMLHGADIPAGDIGRARADYLAADEVYAVWSALPGGAERVQLGLDLTAYLRERGEWELAADVGEELTSLDLPANLQAQVEYEQGLASLRSGDLDGAKQHLGAARELASNQEIRGRARYALAEASFYAGDFPAAHELYDTYAGEYSRDALANDALERVYLLEAGSPLGGGVQDQPGLLSLAAGLYAENRERWDNAAADAVDAVAEAGGEEAEAVRAHALLLLSRAEEKRGFPEEALAAALLVADSLTENRLAPAARRRAGDLLLAGGDVDAALAQYEELLATYPRSWLAPEVRRQVTRLRAGGVQ
jgi:tetratricopeptide (TPR) repeat protein